MITQQQTAVNDTRVWIIWAPLASKGYSFEDRMIELWVPHEGMGTFIQAHAGQIIDCSNDPFFFNGEGKFRFWSEPLRPKDARDMQVIVFASQPLPQYKRGLVCWNDNNEDLFFVPVMVETVEELMQFHNKFIGTQCLAAEAEAHMNNYFFTDSGDFKFEKHTDWQSGAFDIIILCGVI